MSEKIKIPEAVVQAAYKAGCESTHAFGAVSQVIARWMREECAKFAATWADDIPDADTDIFGNLAKDIRKLKS